jgi:hypothetical protein
VSLLKRIGARIHPFDVMVLLLIAIGVVPIGRAWVAAAWILVMIAGAGLLRSDPYDG